MNIKSYFGVLWIAIIMVAYGLTVKSIYDTEPQTIYKPIFSTDTVKINGRTYLRLNTKEDTLYSHYDKFQSDEIVWYERIELRSDLKPVDKDSSIR